MNILITGASGSMAHYLAQRIKESSPSSAIIGIGRRQTFEWESLFSAYFSVDLSHKINCSVLKLWFERNAIDVVFHLASMANVRDSFSNPDAVIANNVNSTLYLFEALRYANISKPKVVLASTSEVYGNVPHEKNPIVEDQPFAPVNPYAISKCTQELIARHYSEAYEIPLVVMRAFGYINPRRFDLVATAVAKQIVDGERSGEPITVRHGNLNPIRSFCDARDIAKAYWMAAKNCHSGVYNIGSVEPISVGGLARVICVLAQRPPLLQKDESLLRSTDIDYCIPNIGRFFSATGWTPSIGLVSSLDWLMSALRSESE